MEYLLETYGEWTTRQTNPWKYHSVCTTVSDDGGAAR